MFILVSACLFNAFSLMQIKKPNLTFLVTFNCVPLQGVNGVFFLVEEGLNL